VLALRDQGVTVFSVPVFSTVIILVIAFIVGVLAAIFPAWRATRIDIIDGIATT
jgi:putative ABC transport system permease protein